MKGFDSFSLRLTHVELLVLVALQDSTLPDGVLSWCEEISDSSTESEQAVRSARAEEALRSLVARRLVYISGEEARVPGPLLHAIELLCSGRWVVEGLTKMADGLPMMDFHLGGNGREGVLCAGLDGGCLSLTYRPEGRVALAEVFDAVRLARADVAVAPTSSDPISMDTLSGERGWNSRVLQAVSVSQSISSPLMEIVWLRMSDQLFLLEAGAPSVHARPIDEEVLRSELERAALVLAGSESD